MADTQAGGVAVVGSANLDVVVRVERLAGPGETVLGGELVETPGGKGLNQAIAAARISRSALVACVGDDGAGDVLLTRLTAAGVGTEHVRLVAAPTGRALIQVAADGENSIIVAPAANTKVTSEHVHAALENLRPDVVIAQLEIPLAAVESVAEWASVAPARFVLNASPVQPLPDAMLGLCDPLVVNVHEAAGLLGEPVGRRAGERLAAGLARRARSVVVTDGSRGAWVAQSHRAEHVPGVQVSTVIDTTGAGDEFAGCLAACLSRGDDLVAATASANAAAARLVAVPRGER